MAKREYTQSTLKRLYGKSGNCCAYPSCTEKLLREKVNVSDICHIEALSVEGARYNTSPDSTDKDRNAEHNLILLCKIHHHIIDQKDEDGTWQYSTEQLKAMKRTIERNFLPRFDAILRIDGEKFSLTGKNKLSQELMRRIFDCDEGKPTFRQIISKNIRDEKDRLNNVLKVLHPTTTSVEYEALYQFWFGVHTDEGEAYQKIRERIRRQEAYRGQLAQEFDVTEFSIIKDLQQSITELKRKKSDLDLEEDFQIQLDAFDRLKAELTRTATKLSSVQLRRQLIEDSANALEKDVSQVTTSVGPPTRPQTPRRSPRQAFRGNRVLPHLCGKETKQRNKPQISSFEVSHSRGQVRCIHAGDRSHPIRWKCEFLESYSSWWAS